METDCRTALAKNLKALMDHHGYTQTKLAEKSGVSQRNISNVLNADCESSPTLETIDKLARAFHLTSWHLLLPGLQIDLLTNSRLEKVVENFTNATHEGRDMISRVSDREAAIAYTVNPIKKKA